MKCLIKNCYKNYKNYIDVSFLSLNNPIIRQLILTQAKKYKIDKEVNKFLISIKDVSTIKKIKLIANLVIQILQKLYKTNEEFIVKMIKENKNYIKLALNYI